MNNLTAGRGRMEAIGELGKLLGQDIDCIEGA